MEVVEQLAVCVAIGVADAPIVPGPRIVGTTTPAVRDMGAVPASVVHMRFALGKTACNGGVQKVVHGGPISNISKPPCRTAAQTLTGVNVAGGINGKEHAETVAECADLRRWGSSLANRELGKAEMGTEIQGTF